MTPNIDTIIKDHVSLTIRCLDRGVAQEKARAFKAHKRRLSERGVTFDFTRQSVSVNHYHVYLHDAQWGPAFIQDRHLSAVSDQGLLERARVGQTTTASRGDPVYESRQRLSLVRGSHALANHL